MNHLVKKLEEVKGNNLFGLFFYSLTRSTGKEDGLDGRSLISNRVLYVKHG